MLRQPEIESRANAWKAFMLPLHHWRVDFQKLYNITYERFSLGERIFTLKLQGVTVHPKRGVERDTHLVTCLFGGCQLGVSFRLSSLCEY